MTSHLRNNKDKKTRSETQSLEGLRRGVEADTQVPSFPAFLWPGVDNYIEAESSVVWAELV